MAQTPSSIPHNPAGVHTPLSLAQQRLWFLYHYNPKSSEYNISRAWRLKGPLNTRTLKASLNLIVARHEALRTTFQEIDGRSIQVIQPTFTAPFLERDWAAYSPAHLEAEIDRFLIDETCQPFDLLTGPLLRFTLIRCAPDDHVFVFTVHHMVFDGTSLKVFCQELNQSYQATLHEQPVPFSPLPIQYKDYAYWQQAHVTEEKLASQLAFWKQHLQGAPLVLDLPSDGARSKDNSGPRAYQTFILETEVLGNLKRLIQPQGITVFMALLTVFQILLFRYSGQRDLLVGTPIAGRTHTDLEKLIGFLVNTLVLRIHIVGQPTFHEILRQVRNTCLEAYRHQDLPFEKLVEGLKPVRDPSRYPVVQAIFQVRQRSDRSLSFPELNVYPLPEKSQPGNFDLHMVCEETSSGIEGFLYYPQELYPESMMASFAKHYEILLKELIAHPQQPVDQISFLTEAETYQQLIDWNNTATDYPYETCLHDLVQDQAMRTPDVIVLVYEDHHLTYREVTRRASQLANYLLLLGVGPEVRVGLCHDRAPDLLIGLLGILQAGGAYVPLDPTYPLERLQFMTHDAQIPIVVTQQHLESFFPQESLIKVSLDRDWALIATYPATPPNQPVRSTSLAYVIYTSGSTGRPKGVQIEHRSVINFLIDVESKLQNTEPAIVLTTTSFSFDISIFEVFGPLAFGGRIILASQAQVLDGHQLVETLSLESVTKMLATPAGWRLLLEANWKGQPDLVILTGGEALSEDLANQLLTRGTALWNLYGPTETTIFSTCTQIHPSEKQTITIGSPIANTQIYILNPECQLVPIGVPGELYIGGVGVSRGYLNRPDLTAERFLPDPFSQRQGGRLYRSGDRARYRDKGPIEWLGRLDQQIKLRGFRIELGEVAEALRGHSAVTETVVVCREDTPGEKQLVAYIVGRATVSELRSYLQGRLPIYMVPSAFVVLKQLPLTPNGKIDRKALHAPNEADRTQGRTYVAPRTPLETTLVAIWKEVLGLDQVGIQDNFFDLGGHSLLATQVVSRVRTQLQLEVTLPTFFEVPTVAGLAEIVLPSTDLESQPTAPPLLPCAETNPLPLSFAQERFWFLEQIEQGEGVFCIPVLLRLQGNLDIAALERSFQTLIRRHEILRTIFHDEKGAPAQIILSDWEYTLSIINLKGETAHERLDAVAQLVEESVLQSFDLRHGPLMKSTLFRGLESEYFLLIAFHHIISDGWSLGIFTQELVAAYDAYSKDREFLLPPLPFQYAEFTLWQHDWLQGERLDGLLNYWRGQLAGAPTVLSLPTDHPRFLAKTFRGASERITLPVSLTRSLKELARRERTTLFMVLLSAFKILLARYTRCFDILVGTPIANRSHTELEKLIGFFANTLVLRTDLSQNPSFLTLLARVRKGCLEAYRHQDLPFEKLVKDLRPERDSIRHPLIQVLFAFQNAPNPSWELEGLQVTPVPLDSQKVAFDVSFSLREQDEKIQGSMTYQIELFDKGTITRMLGHFQSLLESIVTNSEQSIAALTLLTEQERHDLLAPHDKKPTSPRNDRRIHIGFQQHAINNPDMIALVYEDEHVTYRRLNERANQLAHCLQQRGVKPEGCIALHLERSVNLIVGLLGILKAGGCYVPLDPTVPSERLDLILKDARVGLVLTDNDRKKGWSNHPISHLSIDENANFDYQCKEDPCNEVNAGNLAYIIFTSGSTGLPKGVGVTHNNVVRLFEQTQDWFHFDEDDTWTVFHSLAFDFSVWELFGALFHGGKMVLVPHWVSRAPDTFYERVINEQVTILNQTPSAFRQFIRAEEAAKTNSDLALRLVIFGGETLDFQSLNPWWERHGDKVPQLINMYGITETTVHVTYRPLTLVDLAPAATSRIGNPIPDLQIYILDQFLQPVPIGVAGEMYIGGVGVTRGYVNQPQLTSARFIANPYSQESGSRLYRSGDLARYLANGDIEYLGRNDHQVKIRGFRIELGEIESVLAQYPEVRKAVAIVREDQLEDKRLVAYLVVADKATLSIPTLRTYLGQWLPNYMIPSAFMILPSLPLTSNGKTDRERLPAPESSRENSDQPFEQARTPIEAKLVNIWRELLNVAQVGIRDSFFELGGHSLILTKLANRIQDTFQVRLPLRVIFDLPTIESMSQAIVEEQVKMADQVTVRHLLSKLSQLTPEQVSKLLKGQDEG